jgi:hypothetical protein
MAWLKQHPTSGHFKIYFRWSGKKKRKSLPTTDAKAAPAILLRFEENVALLERGRFEVPPSGDIMTFLLSDGQTFRVAKSGPGEGENAPRHRWPLPFSPWQWLLFSTRGIL